MIHWLNAIGKSEKFRDLSLFRQNGDIEKKPKKESVLDLTITRTTRRQQTASYHMSLHNFNYLFLCEFQIFLPLFRSPIPIKNHFILEIIGLGILQNECHFPSTIQKISSADFCDPVDKISIDQNFGNTFHLPFHLNFEQ
jgi:hypothetical protein